MTTENPAEPDPTPESASTTAAPADAAPVRRGFSVDDLISKVDWAPYNKSLGRWKQGHLLRGLPLSWIAPAGTDPFTNVDGDLDDELPEWPEGTFDAVICSQTCDLGAGPPGDQHPTLLVAPLVHELDFGGNRRSAVTSRKVAYLFPVLPANPDDLAAAVAAGEEHAQTRAEKTGSPALFELNKVGDIPKGHRWYADLRLLVPVSKGMLLARNPIEGFKTEAESLAFAETLAQKLRRAALHEALSEDLPRVLDEFIRSKGPTKQWCAKVEQVRVSIEEGDRLYPTRAQLLVFTANGPLTTDEEDVWEELNDQVKKVFNAANITYAPIIHCDVNAMPAAQYRRTVPIRAPLLGHTHWT